MSTVFVGIDVSKDSLDVFVRPLGKALHCSNSLDGFKEVYRFIAPHSPFLVVLESTGALEKPVAYYLHALKLRVAIVNPRQVNAQVENNPIWLAHKELLETVDGVGRVTSTVLIALLPELGKISGKDIAALGGVAPFNKDSGKMRGKKSIYGGRMEVRNILYMTTLSVLDGLVYGSDDS